MSFKTVVCFIEYLSLLLVLRCCINYCNNDKRNESGKKLSFFNFPSNFSQRSQWIAAIKRDEGPLFEVSVPSSRDQ